MALHSDLEIRWKNYRAFEDTKWIKMPALTVLIGPNNSGKTSIISPLLLLNQTMSSRDAVTPLVTRGPLVNAGPFKNIVHNHDISKLVFLGLRYHMHDLRAKVDKISHGRETLRGYCSPALRALRYAQKTLFESVS